MADLGTVASSIVATPIPGGYSWTLASRLGHILRTAEDRYGERDRSYTPLGVEFSPDGPQIWYPGNIRNVVVQIGLECLTQPSRACYQLAHECVHLLSPSGGPQATVFEERLATYYSELYMREVMGQPWHASMASYTEASGLVERLLEIDQAAVKKLREREPQINKIGAGLILELCADIGEEDAQRLASPFERGA